VLLAGGRSSRMGADKAFLLVDGEPLWRRQVRLLESLEPPAIFIAGPELPEWSNYTVIPDDEPHTGPVPVIASALRRAATPLLLVLAVDLPRMTADYLRTLLDGAVPRGQPLCATYPREAAPIADTSRSMQEFATRCAEAGLVRLVAVSPADEHLFFNMNTPADLAALTSAVPQPG
jgi:molybdenum cofactor guanylyltransferase